MLAYNHVKKRKRILLEGDPWEVIDSVVSRKQQNKPVNKTKLKNLISGRVIEHTFHASDNVHEADVTKRTIIYLYKNTAKNEIWFCEQDNRKNRFTLEENTVGDEIKWIKEKSEVTAVIFTDKDGEEQIIGIDYPVKVTLEVTEAPPSIKGDTATGGRKNVVTETGAVVTTPLFVDTGDLIVINTETGEYSERAK